MLSSEMSVGGQSIPSDGAKPGEAHFSLCLYELPAPILDLLSVESVYCSDLTSTATVVINLGCQ